MNEYQKKILEAIENGSVDEFISGLNTKITEVDKINLDFINKSINVNPEYQKDGDSGFDLRADIKDRVIIMIMNLINRTI